MLSSKGHPFDDNFREHAYAINQGNLIEAK